MHNILVTGGAGFIGSHLVDRLIGDGHRVTIFDSLDSRIHHDGIPPDYLNRKAIFVKGDIRDYKHLKTIVKDKTHIFHFASQMGDFSSQFDIKGFFDVNVGGMANLGDILGNSENCCNKLILASSMACYGEGEYKCPECNINMKVVRKPGDLKKRIWDPVCDKCKTELKPVATKETFPCDPQNVYALTKRIQEEIAFNLCMAYRIPVVVLRFFNVFGPRQNRHNPYTAFASEFISRLFNPKTASKIPLIPEDGLQIRDFISVYDAVTACELVLKKDLPDFTIFNVGSGKKRTKLDFISQIISRIGFSKQILITNEQVCDQVRNCYADIRKIKKYTGFKPQINFDTAVEELISWTKQSIKKR